MQLILKETVETLGKMGDLVTVADGYARNFLLPRKIGIVATTRNIKVLEHEKRVIAKRLQKETLKAEDDASRIGKLSLRIPVQVGETEKLFGSVTAKDIHDALLAQGIEIDKKKISLEKPIKELGIYTIPVNMDHGVVAEIKIDIVRADTPATE